MESVKRVAVVRKDDLTGTPAEWSDRDVRLVRLHLEELINQLNFPAEKIRGHSVLLHPNLVRPNPGIIPASSTDPRVILAAVELFRDMGASRICVGENPGFGFPARKAFHAAGLIEPLKRVGADILFFDECDWVRVDIPGGRLYRSSLFSRPVMESDVVVNIPKWKTHMLTGVSLSIKNLLGMIHDDDRMLFHRNDIIDKIVDLATVRPPDLNILDGLWAMEGQAPFHGNSIPDFGCLAASTDMTALDIVAARTMGFEIREIPHLVLAKHRLWNDVDHNIDVVGNAAGYSRRFKRPVLSSAGVFPVECIECGVCNGCLSAIRHSLDKLSFENAWPDPLPDLTVISGRPMPNMKTLSRWKGQLILFGNCAAGFQFYDSSLRQKAVWISGCPPHVLDLDRMIRETS